MWGQEYDVGLCSNRERVELCRTVFDCHCLLMWFYLVLCACSYMQAVM